MGRYSGDPRRADEIIGDEKKATIRRVFPAEYLRHTYDEIAAAAQGGSLGAKTAKKLLGSTRFDKSRRIRRG